MIVHYEEGKLEEALEMKCVCGHKLSYHGFVVSYIQGINTIIVSQCVRCGSYSLIADKRGTITHGTLCKEFKPA